MPIALAPGSLDHPWLGCKPRSTRRSTSGTCALRMETRAPPCRLNARVASPAPRTATGSQGRRTANGRSAHCAPRLHSGHSPSAAGPSSVVCRTVLHSTGPSVSSTVAQGTAWGQGMTAACPCGSWQRGGAATDAMSRRQRICSLLSSRCCL
eukprot:scaffold706_cov418-Prasinococcus_capsulatus_cf.AAC.43